MPSDDKKPDVTDEMPTLPKGAPSDDAPTQKRPQGKIQLAPEAADDVVVKAPTKTEPGAQELPRAGAPVQNTLPSRTRVEPQATKIEEPPAAAAAARPASQNSASGVGLGLVAGIALVIGLAAGAAYYLSRGSSSEVEAEGKRDSSATPAAPTSAPGSDVRPDPEPSAAADPAGSTGEPGAGTADNPEPTTSANPNAPAGTPGAKPPNALPTSLPGWVTSALPSGFPTALPSGFPPAVIPSTLPPFPTAPPTSKPESPPASQ